MFHKNFTAVLIFTLLFIIGCEKELNKGQEQKKIEQKYKNPELKIIVFKDGEASREMVHDIEFSGMTFNGPRSAHWKYVGTTKLGDTYALILELPGSPSKIRLEKAIIYKGDKIILYEDKECKIIVKPRKKKT